MQKAARIAMLSLSSSVYAVLQVVTVVYWYSVKSHQQGLKLDLLKVPMGQWGAFFLLVFLGQVQALVCIICLPALSQTSFAWRLML